ncbi:MAG: DUF2480 family protein [Bacteroidota bacterium]|nr:DUF2480 family protein [Bacteroidota bacterium]MDX5403988.1 DUF2480 family protein [Bacteroidota bacterium]
MSDEIVNRVADSGLITLSLEDLYPQGQRMTLDLADFLFERLMLREKDFREKIDQRDWGLYSDAFVNVICSEDAIIPQWAYMLIGERLQPYARKVVFGSREVLESQLMEDALNGFPYEDYEGKRVILKGCSKLPVPPQAFSTFTMRIRPYVRSLMYGEACSTVPVYKKR